jgi:hypothetical protein
MTILLFIILAPIFFTLLIIYWPKFKTESGIKYESYPTTRWSHGSFPNPDSVIRGYFWSPISKLDGFKYDSNGKNSVFIDTFKMDKDFVKKSRIPGFLKNKYESFSVGFNPLRMTQSLLFIGKMGSGKTEILFNFLNQKFYNRAVIHQVKAGDFVEPYYRERFDIILNPYEKRAHLWDVMSESEGVIKTFFENYMNAVMGDKKDFFSAAANRKYNETMQKIKIQYKDATSSQKWMMFIKAIKDLFQEMETGDQNSSKDVGSTMEQVIEPLEIMAWQMQQKDVKSFTINDFFKKDGQTKLFLDNNPEFEKALTPLFSAFLAALSQVQTSRPDTKEDFSLYAIDEYLSLAATMDDASKKRLHTLIRSKGGILMSFIQYVPKDDKKLQQMLTSSSFAWFIFSVIEEETINLIQKTIGQVEYTYTDESRSGDKSTYSQKEGKKDLISNDILNGLASEFAHLVYIPNDKILYKGYTPQAYVPSRNKKFISRDLTPFYELKYSGELDEIIDVSTLKFEDIFKQKKMTKLDEYKMYKKYLKYKKDGKEEEFKEKEVEPQLKKQKIDFELMFEKFMPKDQVVNNKMKLYTPEERFELMTQWNKISDDDPGAQLKFLEEYDLFGAVPGIFDFKDQENLSSLIDDF